MKKPGLQGTHKNTVKAGKDCGGDVYGHSCKNCGADNIPLKNIKKNEQPKSAKRSW